MINIKQKLAYNFLDLDYTFDILKNAVVFFIVGKLPSNTICANTLCVCMHTVSPRGLEPFFIEIY